MSFHTFFKKQKALGKHLEIVGRTWLEDGRLGKKGVGLVDMKVAFLCDDLNQDQSLILIRVIVKERTPSND